MRDFYTLEEMIYNFFEDKLGSISTLPGLEITSVSLGAHTDVNQLVRDSQFIISIRSSTKAISSTEWQNLLNSVDSLREELKQGIMVVSVGGTQVQRVGSPPQWEYLIQINMRYKKRNLWYL